MGKLTDTELDAIAEAVFLRMRDEAHSKAKGIFRFNGFVSLKDLKAWVREGLNSVTP